MNTEKFLQHTLLSLNSDLLATEIRLEEAINSTLPLDEKTDKVKVGLEKMVLIEAMLAKYKAMITNNKEEEKK